MKKRKIYNELIRMRKKLMRILKEIDKDKEEYLYTYLYQIAILIFKLEYKINKEIMEKLKGSKK